MSTIVLYDLPTKHPVTCWSPNTWKTRALLNWKGLEYRTEWIDYPDVEPLLKERLPPNETGIAFTCPTIVLNGKEWIMDSRKIAQRIEMLHPEPSASLASPMVVEVESLTETIITTICPDFIPKVPLRLLGPNDIPFWHRTRREWFQGMTLEEIEQQQGGDQVYEAAKPQLQRILDLLKQDERGPYFAGEHLTYADVVWASLLRFYEMIGNDVLSKLIALEPKRHRDLLNACRSLLERDDH